MIEAAQNSIEIDAAALAAEADRIELPADPGATAQAEAAPASAETLLDIEARARRDWLGGMQFAVQGFAHVATGWALLPEECDLLALDMAMAAAAWFPNGALPAKYMVLLNLGGHGFMLAAARRDPQTGRFRPLRAPAATDAPAIPAPSLDVVGHGAATSA